MWHLGGNAKQVCCNLIAESFVVIFVHLAVALYGLLSLKVPAGCTLMFKGCDFVMVHSEAK